VSATSMFSNVPSKRSMSLPIYITRGEQGGEQASNERAAANGNRGPA
jgi:hypothetical protein